MTNENRMIVEPFADNPSMQRWQKRWRTRLQAAVPLSQILDTLQVSAATVKRMGVEPISIGTQHREARYELPEILSVIAERNLVAPVERLWPSEGQGFMTPKQSAEFLGITVSKLSRLRNEGRGPAVVEISTRCPRYRPEDLAAWLATQALQCTDTAAEFHGFADLLYAVHEETDDQPLPISELIMRGVS